MKVASVFNSNYTSSDPRHHLLHHRLQVFLQPSAGPILRDPVQLWTSTNLSACHSPPSQDPRESDLTGSSSSKIKPDLQIKKFHLSDGRFEVRFIFGELRRQILWFNPELQLFKFGAFLGWKDLLWFSDILTKWKYGERQDGTAGFRWDLIKKLHRGSRFNELYAARRVHNEYGNWREELCLICSYLPLQSSDQSHRYKTILTFQKRLQVLKWKVHEDASLNYYLDLLY